MDFLEKDLEDIIFEADNEELHKKGLFIYGKKYRQKRVGNYGILDLVTFDRSWRDDSYIMMNGEAKKLYTRFLDITVYELKKGVVDIGALLQALRYCRGIDRYISDYRGFHMEIKLNLVLIGSNVSKRDFCYSPDIIDNLLIYTYGLENNEIQFYEYDNQSLREEGFPSKIK